jgi:hypothetical protein
MRIDSSGSVRINNTSNATFSAQLNTQFTTAFQCGQYLKVTDTSASQSMFIFGNSSSDAVGNIATNGSATSYNTSGTSGVIGIDASTIAINTASSERMRIESDGGVRINNTSNATFSAQLNTQFTTGVQCGMYLKVTNTRASQTMMIFGNTNNDAVGSIATNGAGTSYNTSSDYRLKQDIAPMTGALAKVALLKPCTYKWKFDGSDGEGFIAHELAEVCPHAVTGEKDAVNKDGNPIHQGIDTSFLVATLTAAIQELNAKFEAYKATHP